MMDKETLLDLLERDQIEQVLQNLELHLKGDSFQHQRASLALLSARYYRNRNNENNDTESRETLNREYNRIREGIFSLIVQAFEPPPPSGHRAKALLGRWRWPLMVLATAMLLLAVGMIPVRNTSFNADLVCTFATLQLNQDLPPDHYFSVTNASLFGLRETDDLLGHAWSLERDGGEPQIALESGSANLQDITVAGRPLIDLEITDGVVILSFQDSISYGRLDASLGRVRLPDGTSHSGIVRFTLNPGGTMGFILRDTKTFDLFSGLSLQQIKFKKKEAYRDNLISSIYSGTIQIAGKKEAVKLQEKEELKIEGISNGVLSITILNQNQLRVKIEGSARTLSTGRRNPLTSLKPVLLEKFYSDQRLMFFLLAFGNLMGLLWTVIRALGLWEKG
jgi:hypothetical protein